MGKFDVNGRISTIMMAYNSEKYIAHALEGLVNQTYDNLEIVLVNDGSTDSTEEIARDILNKSGRLHGVYNTNGPSLHSPMTIMWPLLVGIGNSTGEFISIHASDNYSKHNRFELLMNEFNNNPGCSSTFSLCRDMDDVGNIGGCINCPVDNDGMIKSIREEKDYGMVLGDTLLFRKVPFLNDSVYLGGGVWSLDYTLTYWLYGYGDIIMVPASEYYWRSHKDQAHRIAGSDEKFRDNGYNKEDIMEFGGKYSYFNKRDTTYYVREAGNRRGLAYLPSTPAVELPIEKVIPEIVTTPHVVDDIVNYGITLGIQQRTEEIRELAIEVYNKEPQVIVEIGTLNGGTLYMWSKLVNPGGKVISIDIINRSDDIIDKFKSWVSDGTELNIITGNSHDPGTLEDLIRILDGNTIDFLFIDGDHTYNGVSKDLYTYRNLLSDNAIVSFHDIYKEDNDCEVPKFWKEITQLYNNRVYHLDNSPGIGVIDYKDITVDHEVFFVHDSRTEFRMDNYLSILTSYIVNGGRHSLYIYGNSPSNKWLDKTKEICEVINYDDEILRKYNHKLPYNDISNYIRYRILYDKGGLYLDTDTITVKKMDWAVANVPVVGGWDDILCNSGTIYFPYRKHDLAKRFLDECIRRIETAEEWFYGILGPYLTSDVLINGGDHLLDNNNRCIVLSPCYLYSINWRDWKKVLEEGDIDPRSYVLHTWGRSNTPRMKEFVDSRYLSLSNSLYSKTIRSILGKERLIDIIKYDNSTEIDENIVVTNDLDIVRNSNTPIFYKPYIPDIICKRNHKYNDVLNIYYQGRSDECYKFLFNMCDIADKLNVITPFCVNVLTDVKFEYDTRIVSYPHKIYTTDDINRFELINKSDISIYISGNYINMINVMGLGLPCISYPWVNILSNYNSGIDILYATNKHELLLSIIKLLSHRTRNYIANNAINKLTSLSKINYDEQVELYKYIDKKMNIVNMSSINDDTQYRYMNIDNYLILRAKSASNISALDYYTYSSELAAISNNLNLNICENIVDNRQYDNILDGQTKLMIDNIIYKNAAHFQAVAGRTRDALLAEGIDKDKITTVNFWGCNTDLYKKTPRDRSKYNLSEGWFILLFTGRIVEEKGIGTIIDSLNLLPDNVHLLLVGEGNYPLPESDRIHVIPTVSKEELVNLYNCSDIFCTPSLPTSYWEEQFSRSLLEAMSCELVCIASNVGGNPTAIDSGVNGYLIEPHNHIALANIVKRVISEEETRNHIGSVARHTVVNKYSDIANSQKGNNR